jgi:hypothetical protein
VELTAEVVPLAKRSEEPIADTPRRFFLTGVIKPVSESLGMYLQADNHFFPSSSCPYYPSGGAPAAEHEAAPEGPTKRRKKRSPKPPVHLYQFFHHLFSNLFNLLHEAL